MQSLINYILENLEIIKNVVFVLLSVIVLAILIRILFVFFWKIRNINSEIETLQQKLDEEEINDIGNFENLDILGDRTRHKKSIEQKIKKLKRKKRYLLEEISIYKIFKK